MKVALVHDWLNGMRGGEKVLEIFCELFPEAPIFTLHAEKEKLSPLLQGKTIHTSFIQHFPLRKTLYRYYLPFFPLAIKCFNLKKFDIIISLSHCVAKGAKGAPDVPHICYCFTPMRYAWDFYDDYFANHNRLLHLMIRKIIAYLKRWDLNANERITGFITISRNIQNKIRNYYNRYSLITYPPVDTDLYQIVSEPKEDFFLIVSALVPYKRIELAVAAFNELKLPLKIIGAGPNLSALEKQAGPNIEFLGWQSDETLVSYYNRARALIFPGEEDFGIVPLEAMASGTPVIAYGKGGTLETVIENKTGIFFYEQTKEALQKAIKQFNALSFDRNELREQALRFNRTVCKESLRKNLRDLYPQIII